jgi:acyl carrier protein
MTVDPCLPLDPFSIVARALQLPREALSLESRMYRDHGWDSFGHIGVIVGLEDALGIKISDEQTMQLTSMRSILEFVSSLREASQ